MHIDELLKIKIQQDLLNDLSIYYKTNNLNMNYKIYTKIIQKKIKKKTENIHFLNIIQKIDLKNSNNRCCARIWDNHYGTRCKYKRFNDSEYCKHHLNTIKKNGKLIFNRYDEPKPLLNENNNLIPWKIESKIELLNNILQNQWINMEEIIKFNLNKQRQITP